MKKLFKATLAVAIVAAVGVGSYKTYGSYAAEMSESYMLLTENIAAVAEGEAGYKLKRCCKRGGADTGDDQYVCQAGTTFFNSMYPPLNPTVYKCANKSKPKLSLTENNWGYCIE